MVFKEVRDVNFVGLDSKFSSKIIEIDRIVKEKDKPQTVDELEDYIEKLKNLKITKGKDLLTQRKRLNFAHLLRH